MSEERIVKENPDGSKTYLPAGSVDLTLLSRDYFARRLLFLVLVLLLVVLALGLFNFVMDCATRNFIIGVGFGFKPNEPGPINCFTNLAKVLPFAFTR